MPYTLSIPSTTTATDTNSKPYTMYNLTLAGPLRTKVLPKRYSDFDNLHIALTKATSLAPPAPLPSKSWFKRTVNSPELTEERRKGLEAYIKAIEEAEDSRWRNSGVWREFLGLPPLQVSEGKGRKGSGVADVPPPPMTGSEWLDSHNQLKTLLHEARTQLARREQAQTTVQQHEAGANAKKCLVKANTLILRLDDGLKGLQDGRAGEKLGEGEIRRRRDLLGRARKERQGLEGVLNTWVVKHPSSASNRSTGTAMPTASQKAGLFSNAISSNADFSSANSSNTSMPGAFPSANNPVPATSSRRVLGGPPPKETERTRELDNEGVLQLQKQIMQEQDMDVEQLRKTVGKMREMGVAINDELRVQADMLDMLDQDVDRVGAKIDVAKKRVKRIS